MGLLDSMLGQVLGGNSQHNQIGGGAGGMDMGALAGALGGLLANDNAQGGLGGLVSKFQQAGLGDQMNSWIGSGQNQPVSEDQVHQALGADTISSIASKLGINASMLLPLLASVLPQLIDHLTPKGHAPAEGVGNQSDLLSSLSGMLQNR